MVTPTTDNSNTNKANNNNNNNKQQHHHLILIHGAWAGSWVWDDVVPLLLPKGQQQQVTVDAVDLPGNQGEQLLAPDKVNLDVYCQFLRDKIVAIIHENNNCDTKITLVAHSGAGVIALQMAQLMGDSYFPTTNTTTNNNNNTANNNNNNNNNAGGLYSLVIVAGMLLPSGMTYADFKATLGPELSHEPLELQFRHNGMSSVVTKQSALQCFFQDFTPAAAQAAADKLTAQPTRGLAMAATYTEQGPVHRIPKLYIQATQDASVVIGVQRAMQARFAASNLRVVSMDTGHVPQVVQPQVFCRHVMDFLASL